MERLRLKNERLKEEIARGKSQTSSTISPLPLVPMPRKVARRMVDEEGISLQDFLRLRTPEFKEEEGEDP